MRLLIADPPQGQSGVIIQCRLLVNSFFFTAIATILLD